MLRLMKRHSPYPLPPLTSQWRYLLQNSLETPPKTRTAEILNGFFWIVYKFRYQCCSSIFAAGIIAVGTKGRLDSGAGNLRQRWRQQLSWYWWDSYIAAAKSAPAPRFAFLITDHERAKSLSRLLKAEYYTFCMRCMHVSHAMYRFLPCIDFCIVVLVTVVISPLYSIAQAAEQPPPRRLCYIGVPDCVGPFRPIPDCCFGPGSSYRDYPYTECRNW